MKQTFLGKSYQYWRKLKLKLLQVKNDEPSQLIQRLKEIQDAALYILDESITDKNLEFCITQLLAPVTKKVLLQNNYENQEQIDNTLLTILKSSIQVFKNQKCIKAAKIILVITDMHKSYYKQKKIPNQMDIQSNVIEKSIVENKQNDIQHRSAAPTTSSTLKILTQANKQEKKESEQVQLFPIEQAKNQQENYIIEDRKTYEQYLKTKQASVKRAEYKLIYSKIVREIINGQLYRIWNEFSSKSPDFVDKYFQIFRSIMKSLHSEYILENISNLKNSTWDYFIHAQEVTLRNITREIIESIVRNFQYIFERVNLQYQKYQWIQTFTVNLTLPLIRSKLLKNKLIGSKLLSEMCTQIYLSKTKCIRESSHASWLIENKVIQEIFNNENHEQVFQYGSDILKFLIQTYKLKIDELQKILLLIEKGDEIKRKILAKICYDVSIKFNYKQYQVILNCIQKYPADIFIQEIIDLVYDCARFSDTNHNNLGISIFQKLIFANYENYKYQFQQKLKTRYLQLMKTSFQRNYLEPLFIVKGYVEMFQLKNRVILLKIIKSIIEMFPHSYEDSRYYYFKKLDYHIIAYLVEDMNFPNILIQAIDHEELSEYLKMQFIDMYSYLIRNYKQRTLETKFLTFQSLLKVTKFPKIFIQLTHFYNDETQQLFTLLIQNNIKSIQELKCLEELFYRINKQNMLLVVEGEQKRYQVSIDPQNLKGYNYFFKIIFNQNTIIKQEISSFICSLFSNYMQRQNSNLSKNMLSENFIKSIQQQINLEYEAHADNKLLSYLFLIESMMNQTEIRGVGDLLGHSSLMKSQKILITVTNQVTFGYDIIRKLQLKYPLNKTLYQLLIDIAKKFKCSPNQILLKHKDKQIKKIYNGFTIQELNIKNMQFTAYKRSVEQVTKQKLIGTNDKLTPKALAVFTQLYYKFSPSGKMTTVQLAQFIQASTNDSCSQYDYRVTQIFKKYGIDKQEYLEQKNFIQFYQEAARMREGTVWRNLQTLRYRYDLRKYEEVQEKIEEKTLTRYIIYKDDKIYEILFEISKSKNTNLKNQSIKLLKRLPTYKKIIENILSQLKFDHSDEFLIWYKLILIRYILTYEDIQQNQKTEQKNADKMEQQKQPKQSISNKYYNNLKIDLKKVLLQNQKYLVFLQLILSYINAQDGISKNCLLLSLDILRSFNNVPSLNQPLPQVFELQFVELPEIQLDQLLNKLNKNMGAQILQPLLCLLLNKNNVDINWILSGLFNKDRQIRIISNNFLYLAIKLKKINVNLFSIEPKQQCCQFFNMIVKFIQENQNNRPQQINQAEQTQIFQKIIQEIKLFDIKQQYNVTKNNQLLLGKFKILNSLHAINPDRYHNSQFQALIISKLNLISNPNLRQIIYQLLLKTPITSLIQYLHDFIQMIQIKKSTNLIKNNYVGLYNLGCICYMNSMLQQFYMIPEFRYPILSIQDQKQIKTAQFKGKKYKDNVLYQLQKMFSHMYLSQRYQYNPELFCYAFKRDINLGVQQDAQEFLNIIFDKIQTQVKQTYFKNLLNKVFGGKTIVTIVCKTCNKAKQKIEDFNNISLEVKNRKNIQQSLEKFIEQETISDYYCEFCQYKVNITTRETHLYSLPNILIVHLQRIVFNYQTYQKLKIHSKLQFPTSFNLKKFVKAKEGEMLDQSDDIYEYLLKGVVIHSGNSQSGHYYSIIRQGDIWYKFDDSRVSLYNFHEMSEEGFGGKQQYNDWGTQDGIRSKNAYMLFYEKKIKNLIKLQNMSMQNLEQINSVAQYNIYRDNEQQKEEVNIQLKGFKKFVRKDLEADIIRDNNLFFHQLQFYSQGFFKFVKNAIHKIQIPPYLLQLFNNSKASPFYIDYQSILTPTRKLFKNTMQMLLNIIQLLPNLQNINYNVIKQITPMLSLTFYLIPEQACAWFFNLDNKFKRYLEILCSHSEMIIREIYRGILTRLFDISILLYKIRFDLEEESKQKTIIVKYLTSIQDAIYNEVIKNPTKMYQYFEFWQYFSWSNKLCIAYAFKISLISILIDFVLENDSPIKRQKNPRNYKDNKFIKYPLAPIVQTLFALVYNSTIIQSSNEIQQNRHILTQDQKKYLTTLKFYKQVIDQKQQIFNITQLITIFAKDNQVFSQQISKFLIQGINRSQGYETASIYIYIINGFLLINDSILNSRLQAIFGIPQYIASSDLQYSIRGSIQNQNISYISSLFACKSDNYKSVLQLLYIQRYNIDNFNTNGVQTLLNVISSKQQIMKYILKLPGPCYLYEKYIDWIPQFLSEFRTDQKLILKGNKQLIVENCEKNLKIIQQYFANSKKSQQQSKTQSYIESQQHEDLLIQISDSSKSDAINIQNLIIGRNHHVEYIDTIITNQVVIKPIIHHTFVLKSQPIGTDNLALKKELFTFPLYQQDTLKKFFAYSQQLIILKQNETFPQILPSIITFQIQTPSKIKLIFSHQAFNYQIFLNPGYHRVNTPYIKNMIQFLHINILQQKDPQIIQMKQIPNKNNQQNNHEHKGVAVADEPIHQIAGDSYDLKQKVCPDCTFINFGLNDCEICGCHLPN